ncbi:RND transporter [Herminiimonas sp. KBW02]|uniref:efflux transporter outer membrane subunit n=1 Tax=Herminiimonas sp. KBW02 TaxID=2153363 RepID=UPI000F59F003|nr:efflux transporter outer membrane subunit [Herminiimonas sp. KBW02]RQO37247.1 RND transporter [Herminiimonas sp. KBW02]
MILRRTPAYASLLALLIVSGCAVGPDYQRPQASVAQAWKTEPGWQVSNPRDDELKGAWWKVFGDADLNALQEQALTNGQTMVIAQARVDQARAQANVANSSFFPKVGAQAGTARNRTSAERPLTNYNAQNSSVIQNDFNAAFTVSYELDLFGRVRRTAEGAAASAQQAKADFENTRLVLTAELAVDYLVLRQTDAEIDVLQQTLTAQTKALDFISARHELGAASGLDLNQQQGLTAATQTQLTLLRDQRARYQNAIATLVGVPAPDFKMPVKLVQTQVPTIPLTAPAALLERRPDIAAAERAMAAANAQIGVARSAYFPTLGLSGLYGSDANQLSNLFSAPALLWSIGVSATQTIFDGGRTKANVEFARAGYQQAVANYRQSVLVAMQEVQDGLNSDLALAQAISSAKVAADSADRSLGLSTDRYQSGIATNLEVVVAQQTFLNYRRQEVQLNGQRLVNTVKLIKALGGGWPAHE